MADITLLEDKARVPHVHENPKLETWSCGRVAILGDSAPAMPPTLAQGAGCAMMNALGLAVALEAPGQVEDALRCICRRERQKPLAVSRAVPFDAAR